MTMRYAHLSPDVKRDAVKLLDLEHPLSPTLCPLARGRGRRSRRPERRLPSP
jgi:hypothetical protein